MSSASSNQSCVCDGSGYDEMYPLSYKDPDVSSEERSPSASSSRDDDLEMEGSEGGSSDGLIGDNPPIQSVIGPDGLREFILLPLWTVNDFISKIKEPHFKTLRIGTKYPSIYLCVYLTSQSSIITRVLRTWEFMSKC